MTGRRKEDKSRRSSPERRTEMQVRSREDGRGTGREEKRWVQWMLKAMASPPNRNRNQHSQVLMNRSKGHCNHN